MICNDWDITLAGLEESLQQDPKNSSTCRRLADAYAVRGRLKDTVSTYLHLSDIMQSNGDLESALQISNLVLQLQPDSEAARLRRIHLFESRHQFEQCLKAYRELALLYIDQGRGAQAIDLLERARGAHPDNLDLCLELAETHVSEGHIAQALNLFRQAAAAFLQSGELERCCQALRRMKVLIPNEVSILLQLGQLYLQLDRLNEAEPELRGVLRQCLNHEEALMLLGQVCQRKGQSRDACLAFNRLISLNPECWEVHHRLAQVFHGQGMASEAIRSYLAAGEGYLARGERELAITPLRQLLALDPGHPGAICHLANLGACLDPEQQSLPPQAVAAPVAPEPTTPSGELRRELKRRTLPGEAAKQALFKPLPGTQPGPKLPITKRVLVKTTPVDETPIFMQSLGVVEQLDSFPDLEGSNAWLLEEEVDQLPDFEGSCDWLCETPVFNLLDLDWQPPQVNVTGTCPQSTGWPGQIWTQSRFGKLSEELEFWAQVAAENPEMWQARAEWAELCLKVGLCDQAIDLFREVVAAVADHDGIRHRLIQALIWNDQTLEAAEACLELARLYHARQQDDAALESLHLSLQLEPRHVPARQLLADWTTGKVSRHHLGILAEHATQQELWSTAYRACLQLLEHDASLVSARQALMQAAAGLNKPSEAADQARFLLEHFTQSGQWQQACDVCQQLMNWESGHTRLWVKLLEACGDTQRLNQARLELAREMVQDNQFEPAVSLLAEAEDRNANEYLLELLLQKDDQRGPALAARLVEEDLRAQRAQTAQALCSRMLQCYPDCAELLYSLGQVYLSQGQWEAALQQFQQSRRQPGWLHKSTHALALCLRNRDGMEEVARRQIEKVLLVPGKPEELEALRQLLY